MRALLVLLCLAACAPSAPPQPRLTGDIRSPRMHYICSVTGEEAMIYTTSRGEVLDPQPTGRACDYAAYRSAPPRDGW